MKLVITTTTIALLALSMPAAAQYRVGAPNNTMSGTTSPPPNGEGQGPGERNGPGAAGQKINVSNGARKAIIDLQDAVNKADYANIPAKVTAAQAVATTPDDKYAIGQLRLKAAVAEKDSAGESAAIDAIANSKFVDAETSSKLYASLGTTLYNDRQFPQAAAAFQKAATLSPINPEILALLGEAKFAQGQKAEAAAVFQQAVQVRMASGQKPDEALLKRGITVAYDAKSPIAVQLGREWAATYPSPDSWRNSIVIYRNMNHPDVEGTLDLLRLMQATNAMTTPGDYALFAEAAADQSNFDEAQAVIDAGTASHIANPSDAQFRDIISGLKSKPMATAADLESAAKASASAINLLRIGDRYYGMGNYARAAEVYRQVLTKSDADKALANLHLGMALARAGDKAGATAALNAVAGGRSDIAKFWLVYVQQHS